MSLQDAASSKEDAADDDGEEAVESIVLWSITLPFELLRDAFHVGWNIISEIWTDIQSIKAAALHYGSLLMFTYTYCFLGGFLFKIFEGWFELTSKCELLQIRNELVGELWNQSAHMDYDEWNALAVQRLQTFEEKVHQLHEEGIKTYSGSRIWTFDGALVYSITIFTTIGYGHIVPSTTAGRALTMVYATIGIPLLLMVLTDFGKLLTRGIKCVCLFTHRFYYTRSCRKLRRTRPVQAMNRAINSHLDSNPADVEIHELESKAPAYCEIDDDFNLPVWVAVLLLLVYIMLGGLMFFQWERWTYFESVYFVFISMSTIGFGDYVPDHPMFMMGTFVYLLFGMSLTSMCINVLQESLTTTFRKASAKLSVRMGIHVVDKPPPRVEVAPVHEPSKNKSD